MTETAEAERLVASLTAALDEEEAAAKAASFGEDGAPWTDAVPGMVHIDAHWIRQEWSRSTLRAYVAGSDTDVYRKHIARQDPARTLRRVAAHREILDRYAGTLRDYAWSLKQARGGPVANADLDQFEAELPVLRSIVEIIAGIYEETP